MENPKLKGASERLLIVDFGSQVTQLIARRVREAGVYCEIHPWHNVTPDSVRAGGYCGIILSGGPDSVTQEDSPRISREILEAGLPVLGVCYGMQFMCAALGGSVEPCNVREFGRSVVSVQLSTPLTKGVWDKGGMHVVWMSHGDKVASLPDGFSVIASSEGAPFAAAGDPVRKLYGVQFHPEVTHTPDGPELIRNFVIGVCGCSGTWTMSRFLTNSVEAIRLQTGENGRVICAVSGGVDSTVTAALIHRAIGERLTCIFVDTGLLRKDEAVTVRDRFEQIFHIKINSIDASELFLTRLAGVTDPEQKRKIIGNTFIEVFEREAERSGGAEFLAQGTLYPDVIESVSVHGKASVIKSHHNVGGLPERMNMKLVEPLRELFKDEVRALGLELGLHEDLVRRHPFPGPGLAIRIPGEVTAEKADILREADAVFLELIRKEGLYHEIWQAFVALLPVKAVGVMGDARTYEYACALRAVTSTDGMTADAYDFSPAFLRRCASEIINRVKGVNRVLVDFTSKPPGTIEWE